MFRLVFLSDVCCRCCADDSKEKEKAQKKDRKFGPMKVPVGAIGVSDEMRICRGRRRALGAGWIFAGGMSDVMVFTVVDNDPARLIRARTRYMPCAHNALPHLKYLFLSALRIYHICYIYRYIDIYSTTRLLYGYIPQIRPEVARPDQFYVHPWSAACYILYCLRFSSPAHCTHRACLPPAAAAHFCARAHCRELGGMWLALRTCCQCNFY